MKKQKLIRVLSVALASILPMTPSSAVAEGFFIGAEGSLVVYPNWAKEIKDTIVSWGYTSYTSTQLAAGIGAGIHGGQWVNDNFGWEVGYSDLGETTGDFSAYDFAMGNFSYDWNASASALHALVLGGIKFGRNKVFGKIGLYQASTKVELVDTTPGAPGSTRVYSNKNSGLQIGGGYVFSFTSHLSGSVGLSILSGVKFADLPTANMNKARSENLTKLAVGLDYMF